MREPFGNRTAHEDPPLWPSRPYGAAAGAALAADPHLLRGRR